MTGAAKALTARQRQVYELLEGGQRPKEIAQTLGTTETNIYQIKRRLIQLGHLPRKPRTAVARKRQTRSNNGHHPAIDLSSVIDGFESLIDPVDVLSRRVEAVSVETDKRATRIEEDTLALRALEQESKRLANALTALTP